MALLAVTLSACAGGTLVASGWPGISADGETAYVAFNTQVYAVNLNSGTEKWRFPLEEDSNITFYAAPAMTEDGQIIVGGYDTVLYSLNSLNGQSNWTFGQAEDRFVGSSLVSNDTIFAPNSDGALYALDTTGATKWAQPLLAEKANWSKPATGIDCECVYMASMDHTVYAINPETGEQIWRSESLGGASVGIPAVSEDGYLYVGTFINEMVALDAKTGAIIWRIPTEGWAWASPVIDGDVLYFSDIAGNFYAIDRQTQAQLWRFEAGSRIVGTPLVTEDGIYFTSEAGILHALTHEGATRWTKNFEATLHTGPVAAGDLILVATDEDGLVLLALDAGGAQKWQYTPAE